MENLKLLIVDDNTNNLYSLNELIKSNFDVQILEANSGYEALRIINEQVIDLCLMDVQMPELDGIETAKLIKTRPKTAHIPVIFITAFDPNKILMEKGINAGGLDYLSKPIDDVQIVHMLHMYFRFIERERNINAELEEKVQIRTFELENANHLLKLEIEERKRAEIALLESEKKLQEANAAKDKFFRIIAHDLRNPFNAVIGFSSMLKKVITSNNKNKIEEYTDNIFNAATNANVLLNNLLEWACSQTNMISYTPEKFDVNEIIESTLSVLSGESQKKNIAIFNKMQKGIFTVADKNMISTVIRNLISNSIKFTANGGSVSIHSLSVNGFLEISVEDTGIGIKKDDIDKLFRIDTKVLKRGTANETGSGLGLILCREFIEKNGGNIYVKSEFGKGSSFSITLPKFSE